MSEEKSLHLDSLVKDLQDKINKQKLLITELKQHIKDSGDYPTKLKEKESTISQLQNKINELQAQLTERNNKIKELTNETKLLNAQIPECQKLIQELQQQLSGRTPQPSVISQQSTAKSPSVISKPAISQPAISQPAISQPAISTPTPSVGGSAGRRECPKCGASGFAIKEVEDRTRIISYVPKTIYAKKKHCTKCGYEF